MTQGLKHPTFFDYCHEPYVPVKDIRNHWLSADLWNHCLEQEEMQPFLMDITSTIQDAIGTNNTVWGIKFKQRSFSYELYFYNVHKRDPRITVSHIFKALRTHFKITLKEQLIEKLPYFMFSIDLDRRTWIAKKIFSINIYLTGRMHISQGISMRIDSDGGRFENFYDFYSPANEREALLHRLRHCGAPQSAHPTMLWDPYWRHCHKVCIANKKSGPGIYFSRVSLRLLIQFLEYFNYPSHVISLIKIKKRFLDHMLYDIAFDCCGQGAKLAYNKSSFYGTF